MKIFYSILGLIFVSLVESHNNTDYLKSWKSLEYSVSNVVKQLFNNSLVNKFKSDLIKNDLINKKCSQTISHYIDSIANMDYWAVKMFDSSGKIPSGLLEGTLNDMGSYDECLEIPEATYCLIDWNIDMPERDPYHSIATTIGHKFNNFSEPGKVFHQLSQTNSHYFYYLSYRLGVCLPSVCSEDDIKQIIISELNRNQIGLKLKKIHCEVKESLTEKLDQLNKYQIISIIYITILVVLLIIGTINHSFGDQNSIFETFSVQNNLKRLSSFESPNQTMTCLQGMRLFSICWIILGHCYGWISFQIFRRSFAATEIMTSVWFQPLMGGSLAVDTFFLMSGFLTVYVSITQFERTRFFSVPIFIFHRIWRFLPHLLFTLSLTFIVPILGSGPVWNEIVEPTVKSCQQNWWTNVLFINHWVNSDNICLLHTWYLGCDLHFYVLSLLVIIPFIKSYKRLAAINSCLFIIFGTISTAVVLAITDYPPTLLYAQPKVEERLSYVLQFYIKPYSHFGSYGIGLILGLVVHSINPKRKHLILKKKYVISGWILVKLTITAIMSTIYPWNNGLKPDIITSIIYGSLHRTVWSVAVAWIIFICINDRGGVVNKILSYKPLIPLSRITFSVYLVHPIIHWMRLGSIRERIVVSHYDGLYALIPTVVLSFIFGLICSLLCESPLLAIEKRVIKTFYHKYHKKSDDVFEQTNQMVTYETAGLSPLNSSPIIFTEQH